MASLSPSRRWVPSAYYIEGLLFSFVALVAPVYYKQAGYSNTAIAFYTSLFTFPWVVKWFFAPLLENFNKKSALLLVQLLVAMLIFLLALSLHVTHMLLFTGILFVGIATLSSLNDLLTDGIYLETLTPQQQAEWIGMRTMLYQLGKMTCQGGLIYLVGMLIAKTHFAWRDTFVLASAFVLVMVIYHRFSLPNTVRVATQKSWLYRDVLHALLATPYLVRVSLFLIFYNSAEAMLNKMIPLYMLDSRVHGGLQFSLQQVSLIYGSLGLVALILGVLAASKLIVRYSLAQCLLPISIFALLANASYLIYHFVQTDSVIGMASCVFFSEFAYGFANSVYLYFLMRTLATGQYKMSLYAVGTAFMQLGILLAGAVSGYIQSVLDYSGFFIVVIVLGVAIVLLAKWNLNENITGV